MAWEHSDAQRHFAFAAEKKHWSSWRTICGTCVPRQQTIQLRKAAVVDCVPCMLVKDAWLEGAMKPLTVRRGRDMWRTRFDAVRPVVAFNRRTAAEAQAALVARTPEQVEIDEAHHEASCMDLERSIALHREDRKRADAAAALGRLRRLVATRAVAVERMTAKLARTERALKRAKRRHAAAARRLAKAEPVTTTAEVH